MEREDNQKGKIISFPFDNELDNNSSINDTQIRDNRRRKKSYSKPVKEYSKGLNLDLERFNKLILQSRSLDFLDEKNDSEESKLEYRDFINDMFSSSIVGTALGSTVYKSLTPTYRKLKAEKNGSPAPERENNVSPSLFDEIFKASSIVKRKDDDVVENFTSLTKGKLIVSTNSKPLFSYLSEIDNENIKKILPKNNFENYLNIKKAIEFTSGGFHYAVVSDIIERATNLFFADGNEEGKEEALKFFYNTREDRNLIANIELLQEYYDRSGRYLSLLNLYGVLLMDESIKHMDTSEIDSLKRNIMSLMEDSILNQMLVDEGFAPSLKNKEEIEKAKKNLIESDKYKEKMALVEELINETLELHDTPEELAYRKSTFKKIIGELGIETDFNLNLKEILKEDFRKLKTSLSSTAPDEINKNAKNNGLFKLHLLLNPDSVYYSSKEEKSIAHKHNFYSYLSLVPDAGFNKFLDKNESGFGVENELFQKISSLQVQATDRILDAIKESAQQMDFNVRDRIEALSVWADKINKLNMELREAKSVLEAQIPFLSELDISFSYQVLKELFPEIYNKSNLANSILETKTLSFYVDKWTSVLDSPPSLAIKEFSSKISEYKKSLNNPGLEDIVKEVEELWNILDDDLEEISKQQVLKGNKDPDYETNEKVSIEVDRLKNKYKASFGYLLAPLMAQIEYTVDKYKRDGKDDSNLLIDTLKNHIQSVKKEFSDRKEFVAKNVVPLSIIELGNLEIDTNIDYLSSLDEETKDMVSHFSVFAKKSAALYNSSVILKKVLSDNPEERIKSEELVEILKSDNIIFNDKDDKLLTTALAVALSKIPDDIRSEEKIGIYAKYLSEIDAHLPSEMNDLQKVNQDIENLLDDIKDMEDDIKNKRNSVLNRVMPINIDDDTFNLIKKHFDDTKYVKLERKEFQNKDGDNVVKFLLSVNSSPDKFDEINAELNTIKERLKSQAPVEYKFNKGVKEEIDQTLKRVLDKSTPSYTDIVKLATQDTYFNYVANKYKNPYSKLTILSIYGSEANDCFRNLLVEQSFNRRIKTSEERIKNCIERGLNKAKQNSRLSNKLVEKVATGDVTMIAFNYWAIWVALAKEVWAEFKVGYIKGEKNALEYELAKFTEMLRKEKEDGKSDRTMKDILDDHFYEKRGFTVSVIDEYLVKDALKDGNVMRLLKQKFPRFNPESDILIYGEDNNGERKAVIIHANLEKLPERLNISQDEWKERIKNKDTKEILSNLGLDESKIQTELKKGNINTGFELVDDILLSNVYEVLSKGSIYLDVKSNVDSFVKKAFDGVKNAGSFIQKMAEESSQKIENTIPSFKLAEIVASLGSRKLKEISSKEKEEVSELDVDNTLSYDSDNKKRKSNRMKL